MTLESLFDYLELMNKKGIILETKDKGEVYLNKLMNMPPFNNIETMRRALQ